MKLFIGFDTSAYTTSIAAVDEEGKTLLCEQRLLSVPLGERGLRQSDALFQHVRAMRDMSEKLREVCAGGEIAAVCASVAPRPVEGSYMPVFLASDMVGRMLAAGLGVPFYPTSHQENHISAIAGGRELPQSFYAIHLSGGTSELVRCDKRAAYGYDIELIGETQDLHAGQLVDRVGVALGLPFPSGASMEKLAADGKAQKLPVFLRERTIGFSGAEAKAAELIRKGAEKADVAASIYKVLGETMFRWIRACVPENADEPETVVCAGGVFSSRLLRAYIAERLPHYRLLWTDADVSRDNALGCALMAREAHMGTSHE